LKGVGPIADLHEHPQGKGSPQAVEALSRALVALQCAEDAPVEELLQLHYQLGSAYRYLGDLGRSLEQFSQCLELAKKHEATPWEIRSAHVVGEIYLRQRRIRDALEAFTNAATRAEATGDQVSALVARARQARALSDGGQQEEALRLTDAILESVASDNGLGRGDRYFIAGQALLTLGVIRFRGGKFRSARRFLQRSLKLLSFTDAELPRAESMRLLGIIDSEQKLFASAVPRLYEAWEIYRNLNYHPGRFDTYWSLAITYLDMGDLRNARLCLKQAEGIAKNAQLDPEYAKTRSKLADIEMCEGRYEAALDMYFEDLRMTEATGDRQALGYCCLNLGHTFRRLRRFEEAKRYLEESIRHFQDTHRDLLSAQAQLELAETGLEGEDFEGAERLVREAEPVLRQSEDPAHAAMIDRMMGKIFMAGESPAKAVKCFSASIEQQLKRPPTRMLAETRLEAALASDALGDPVVTLDHLRNAVGLAEALGSRDVRDAALRKLEGIDKVEAQTLKLVPYLPANAIQEMVSRWVDIDQHKSTVTATVMFVDMRGYTTLSGETDSFALIEAVEAFLSLIVRIINHHGGTVDKFIGDCVMATFGWGQTPEQGAHMAVWAGIEMLEQLQATTRVRVEAGAGALHVSIGVNTGEVVAGCFGPLERRDYTVIGYNVNLAARLQSLASEIDVPEADRMLLSNASFNMTREIIEAEPLHADSVHLKGIRDEEVGVFRYLRRRTGFPTRHSVE